MNHNFYSQAYEFDESLSMSIFLIWPNTVQTLSLYCRKNDPAVLEKRGQRVEKLETSLKSLFENNHRRIPDWDVQRIEALDAMALAHGKRCIMWDDQGAGFYLLINWDWLQNKPAVASTSDTLTGPGWWENVRRLLQPPLIDPDIPQDALAAWIDNNTMRVHARLLDNIDKIRPGTGKEKYTLHIM